MVTASACAGMLKEYREILSSDPAYAAKAERVAELCLDISEVLEREDLGRLQTLGQGTRVAFHSPCTLQHGLGLGGRVEALLSRLGRHLLPAPAPAVGAPARRQTSGLDLGPAAGHRHCQYRLPQPPAGRSGAAGDALDRIAGRTYPVIESASSSIGACTGARQHLSFRFNQTK